MQLNKFQFVPGKSSKPGACNIRTVRAHVERILYAAIVFATDKRQD